MTTLVVKDITGLEFKLVGFEEIKNMITTGVLNFNYGQINEKLTVGYDSSQVQDAPNSRYDLDVSGRSLFSDVDCRSNLNVSFHFYAQNASIDKDLLVSRDVRIDRSLLTLDNSSFMKNVYIRHLDVSNTSITQDLLVSRNSYLTGTLAVKANASFETTVQAHNVSIVQDLQVSRDTYMIGTLAVKANASFERDVSTRNVSI